jgi:hypothetical protein
MNKAAPRRTDNVVPLRSALRTAAQDRAAQTTGQVRRHLSLLQGYADLLEGLSPEQNMKVLAIMAEKIRELTKALHPFLAQANVHVPALEDYRQARLRSRQLLAEYRLLLDRFHDTVKDVQGRLPPA